MIVVAIEADQGNKRSESDENRNTTRRRRGKALRRKGIESIMSVLNNLIGQLK